MGPPRDGDNAVMIESFEPNTLSILNLIDLAAAGKYVAVHIYSADFNHSLAAYLIGAQRNTYWGIHGGDSLMVAWMCDTLFKNWHWEYDEALGAPLGEARNESSIYTRSFSSGTNVTLNLSNPGAPSSCIRWASGKTTGANCSTAVPVASSGLAKEQPLGLATQALASLRALFQHWLQRAAYLREGSLPVVSV